MCGGDRLLRLWRALRRGACTAAAALAPPTPAAAALDAPALAPAAAAAPAALAALTALAAATSAALSRTIAAAAALARAAAALVTALALAAACAAQPAVTALDATPAAAAVLASRRLTRRSLRPLASRLGMAPPFDRRSGCGHPAWRRLLLRVPLPAEGQPTGSVRIASAKSRQAQ